VGIETPTMIFDSGKPDMKIAYSKEQLFPPVLKRGIHQFISGFREYNSKMPEHAKKDERNYTYLEHFLEGLFTERTQRTYEVETKEYGDAVELAKSQFDLPLNFLTCIDGRILTPLMFGISFRMGNALRMPGGILREFIRIEDGSMHLVEGSVFAELLNSAVKKSKRITEVLDCHVACAARGLEEGKGGKEPDDGGLGADILYKKEMAKAIEKYSRKHFRNKDVVLPIITSFNVNNSFMYMGFETDYALEYARNITAARKGRKPERVMPEFTDDVKEHLVKEGKAISTLHLLEDPTIKDAFVKHGFDADWKNNFVETASNFWNSINNVKTEIIPIIKQKILDLYPHLSATNLKAQEELQVRSMLLLTNAFSGFLNNKRDLNAVSEMIKYHRGEELENGGNGSRYEDSVHREQFIKVYEGGQPPYNTSAFVIYNGDLENLPENIVLGGDLVRKNRKASRAKDNSKNFTNQQEFSEAIVPVVFQEILNEDVPEEEWQKLEQIDFSDIPTNWDTMSSAEFLHSYLSTKNLVPEALRQAATSAYLQKINESDFLEAMESGGYMTTMVRGINKLRITMARMYDPKVSISQHFIDQLKIGLPVISGRNRRIRAVIPFVKYGFSEATRLHSRLPVALPTAA
jgi:hypothetical protein